MDDERCCRCDEPIAADEHGNWHSQGDYGCTLWTGHDEDGPFVPMHTPDPAAREEENDAADWVHEDTVPCLLCIEEEIAQTHGLHDLRADGDSDRLAVALEEALRDALSRIPHSIP